MMYSSLRVVIVLLASATALFAQDSLEYGKQAAVPPKLQNPTSSLATQVGEVKPAQQARIIEVPPAKPTKPAQAKGAPKVVQPATPPPTTVFILSNGDQIEATEYVVNAHSVQLMEKGSRRTIPLNTVNVPATEAANKQRGIPIKMPTNSAEMVLAF
jgi:hypothetical protein